MLTREAESVCHIWIRITGIDRGRSRIVRHPLSHMLILHVFRFRIDPPTGSPQTIQAHVSNDLHGLEWLCRRADPVLAHLQLCWNGVEAHLLDAHPHLEPTVFGTNTVVSGKQKARTRFLT